jgi:hypothetical protein
MRRLGILSIALIVLCLGALSPGTAQAQPKNGDAKQRVAELKAKLAKIHLELFELWAEPKDREKEDEPKKENRKKDETQIARRAQVLEAERQETTAALAVALREAPRSTTREDNLALVAMLQHTIDTKGLRERVKLKTALEYFENEFAGKLPILVDKEAFAAELGADAPDPYEEEVSLPPVPAKMTLSTALRLVVSQVGKGETTFLIRQGHVEITTLKASSAAYLLVQAPIFASFDNRPLQEVLDDFADERGIAIHLDPSIGKKGQTAIKAKFHNASLEDALVTVTEMAELKYVILERSIYITTAEKAAIMRKEEKQRALERKDIRPKAKRLEAAL